MVRAAVSGAIDYSRADPTNINWRLQQKLVLQEVQRCEALRYLEAAHQQWLAYVAHGNLNQQSFDSVKKSAAQALDSVHKTLFPWVEPVKTEAKNDTILLDSETQELVDKYKEWQAELKNQQSPAES